MAAIDKIYLKDYEEYKKFYEWCKEQPPIEDKYGKKVTLVSQIYHYDEPFYGCHPVAMLPYYLDAYLIRNCPIESVQKELMLNYGHWSQEKIDDAYKIVMERGGGKAEPGEFYSWLSSEDFVVVDGVVTMPNLEKSDYSKIKDGELFTTPYTSMKYEVGRHFSCIQHPPHLYNKPFGMKTWWVNVDIDEELRSWMKYHDETDTWDFYDEFVDCEWSSNTANVTSIAALKRKILKKWKLPVGARLRVTGRLISDTYVFVIKK